MHYGLRVILPGPAMTSVPAARSGRTVVPASLNFNPAEPVRAGTAKNENSSNRPAYQSRKALTGIQILARKPITMPAR